MNILLNRGDFCSGSGQGRPLKSGWWLTNSLSAPPGNLGEAIKRSRRVAGWTGEDLAEWLGVNKATVYHWENGGQILRKKDRDKVGLFLGQATPSPHRLPG